MKLDDDDLRPGRFEATGAKAPTEEERKRRFAKAMARAEFGRFYCDESLAERLRSTSPGREKAKPARPRPGGSPTKVRQG